MDMVNFLVPGPNKVEKSFSLHARAAQPSETRVEH